MSKIALISLDPIGAKLAGPGIRYVEMAKFLSEYHEVVLVAPNQPEISLGKVQMVSQSVFFSQKMYKRMNFVVGQNFELYGWDMLRSGVKLIGDFYIPYLTEGAENIKHKPHKELLYRSMLLIARQRLVASYHILCASNRQKDMYFGMLLDMGKVKPFTEDSTLITTIPFGLNEAPPVHTRQVLKGVHPGIKSTDKVIIWNGGIWNWFDPLTLISAMDQVVKQRDDVKLYFMGVKHPSDDVPEMKMASDAMKLAKELGLYDTNVFFNTGWVDFEDRQNYLLESDLSVCLAPQGLENEYSFRTRILDCIWARIPTIISSGSELSEVIATNGIGMVINESTPENVAESILEMLRQVEVNPKSQNFEKVIEIYRWSNVLKPLHNLIEPANAASQNTFNRQLRFAWLNLRRKFLAVEYKILRVLS